MWLEALVSLAEHGFEFVTPPDRDDPSAGVRTDGGGDQAPGSTGTPRGPGGPPGCAGGRTERGATPRVAPRTRA